MFELAVEFLKEFREGVFLLLGALIGYVASVAMWKRQLREQRKAKRAEHILRAVYLASSSLTYGRALLYSHLQGVEGVLNLPSNPVDELMAIAGLHLPEMCPLVQELHDKQQLLFGEFSHEADPARAMLEVLQSCVPIVNQLTKQLRELSSSNSRL